jgi:hypothetical protein
MTVTQKITVFRDVMPFYVEDVQECSGGTAASIFRAEEKAMWNNKQSVIQGKEYRDFIWVKIPCLSHVSFLTPILDLPSHFADHSTLNTERQQVSPEHWCLSDHITSHL